ncbi:hypothetical protein RDABS01_038495, partial [Bienertia sinuspersici]
MKLKAFLKAWGVVCAVKGASTTLTIPARKTFLLTPISFQGPCNSSTLHFEVYKNYTRTIRVTALTIVDCNGLQLKGLTHKDSPGGHISLVGCDNSIISNLRIIAPQHSPNTDGIDICSSTQVQIRDSIIATGNFVVMNFVFHFAQYTKFFLFLLLYSTHLSYIHLLLGDDCIAIGNDTSRINITRITCGPGHGIRVEGVSYRRFHGTSASEAAISLNCSSTVACTGIFMDSINITSSNPSVKTYAFCQNARGKEALVAPH